MNWLLFFLFGTWANIAYKYVSMVVPERHQLPVGYLLGAAVGMMMILTLNP